MLFFKFQNSLENVGIYSAFIFFILFLVYVLIGKKASGKDSYTKVNRIHSIVFCFYSIFFLGYLFYDAEFLIDTILIAIMSYTTGSFIFFSLHYVFLFSLIGISKKSISINLLGSIQSLEKSGASVTKNNLTHFMHENNLGIGEIRENRLAQMTHLKWAECFDSTYSITSLGKRIYKVNLLIFKIWNQKRL